MLFSSDPAEQSAASWAFAWLGELGLAIPASGADTLGHLFAIWQHSLNKNIGLFALWALVTQPLIRNEGLTKRPCQSISRSEFENVLRRYDKLDANHEKSATILVAWYLGALPDEKLLEGAQACLKEEAERGGREETAVFRNLRELISLLREP
jgi:hypothetical protein